MSTPALAGTVAGSRFWRAIAKAKCIRYARSGGRSVSAIVTVAPASFSAARNFLTLARNGSISLSGLLLFGNSDTQLGPLSGIVPPSSSLIDDCRHLPADGPRHL